MLYGTKVLTMIRIVLLATVLALSLASSALADSWTSGQLEWARHGSRHGAWDCFGRCPEGHSASSHALKHTTTMHMACQKDLQDGRMLVSDGSRLPFGARTRIVSYRPMTRSQGWSNGPCVVAVTR